MKYYSTRHQSSDVTLKDAILHGVAPDGGLYMPSNLPKLPQAFFNNISEMSAKEISYFVANSLFSSDLPSSDIKRIGDETFNFSIPLKKIEDNIYALELYHGPTMVVKDIGARFLPRMLAALHPDLTTPLNVLVATHGHSGNAVANGFHNVKGVNVFTLYPKSTPASRVSQLNSLGDNIYAIRVNGSIDDCRQMITSALADRKLNESLKFTCANSTNIGRVLPQSINYFYAYAQLIQACQKPGEIYVSVPCGNAGNLLAGLFAKKMGLPIDKLIAACNANAGFEKLIDGTTGTGHKSIKTLAYAIDTCYPSNAQRFIDIYQGNMNALKEDIICNVSDDECIKSTIADVYERTGYKLDPHSAVSYHALKHNLPKGATGIFLATASPARSINIIESIIGQNTEHKKQQKRLKNMESHEILLPPTYPALRKYMLGTLCQ